MVRVLIVNDTEKHLTLLREGLAEAGCELVGVTDSAFDLPKEVERLQPDVIIIDTESPTRDVLEQVCVVTDSSPRPIVMFTADRDNVTIRAAVKAGVTAYIVDGLGEARLRPIMEVAMARFEQERDLKNRLDDAESKLIERKVVERAKGVLMRKKGLDEATAYELLRKQAMRNGQKLSDVAKQLIDLEDLLG